MYVRMSTTYGGPHGRTQAGDTIEVGPTQGAALLAGGYGVEVDAPDGLPVPPIVSNPVVGANIYVGAEVANVRDIRVQLVDEERNPITEPQTVRLAVLADANGAAYATTGGSTGIQIDGAGAIVPIVAKKLFQAVSDNEGEIHVAWTDTGTEAAYLAVILPSGRIVISEAITNS